MDVLHIDDGSVDNFKVELRAEAVAGPGRGEHPVELHGGFSAAPPRCCSRPSASKLSLRYLLGLGVLREPGHGRVPGRALPLLHREKQQLPPACP
jgi:hypothetical protein